MKVLDPAARLSPSTSENSEPSAAQIIPDCLEQVFKYLTTADKGRAAQVCRLWKDTCYRRSVWKGVVPKLRLSRTSEDVLRSIHSRGIRKIRVNEHKNNLERITRTIHMLESLDITGCHYTTDEALRKAFAMEMQGLRELDLSYCICLSDLGLSSALDKCPELESLALQGCLNIYLSTSAKASLKRCKRLRTLNVAGCKQLNLSSLSGLFEEDGIRELKSLNLRDCDRISDGCLQYISTHLKSLESLNLSFCISVTDEGLEMISKGLPNLRSLKLQSVDDVSSFGIAHIAEKCTRLMHLDLGFCEWVDDNCLEKIASGRIAESLEELDLSCAHITDEGIRIVSESLLQLKHLKIGQCLSLTDQSLALIGSSLTKLVTIDFYGCNFSGRAINSIWDTLPNLWLANNFMISTYRRH